ncbi:DAK2 domain-containing protein, partial [Plastoroseomonas hellenica]
IGRGEAPAAAMASTVAAAEAGAAATTAMRPRVGRASYLGDRAIGNADAGAMAVVVWLRALAGVISSLETPAPG